MKENTRNRTSVAITGIDTSTPDNTVADGKCADLHNARYAAGAWRNVCNIPVKHSAEGGNYRIVYHHPAAGDNVYIVYERGTTMIDGMQANRYSLSTITFDENDGSITEKTKIYSYASRLGVMGDTLPFNISHFGNVLIIGNSITKKAIYMLLVNGMYKTIDIDRHNISVDVESNYIRFDTSDSDFAQFRLNKDLAPEPDPDDTLYGTWRYGLKLYGYQDGATDMLRTKGKYWRGEIAFFVALRTESGAILYRSPLQILTSYGESNEWLDFAADGYLFLSKSTPIHEVSFGGWRLWLLSDNTTYGNKASAPDSVKKMSHGAYVLPTVNISLSGIDEDIVYDAAIYATRINQMWDFDKIKNLLLPNKTYDTDGLHIESSEFYKCFADNALPEQPFYLAKAVCIKEFESGKISIELDADLLADIETKGLVYTPVMYTRYIYGDSLEYNNSIHFFNIENTLPDIDVTLTDMNPEDADTSNMFKYASVRAVKNDIPYIKLADIDNNDTLYHCGNVIDYPDTNVTEMAFMTLNQTGTAVKRFAMSQALANGLVYYTAQVSAKNPVTFPAGKKYHTIRICVLSDSDDAYNPTITAESLTAPVSDNSRYVEPNKLKVSSTNNPFNIDFANSYAIGSESNRILAVNSAAIEMSDAKFGEMPLYVFTEEGIFAIQSGSSGVLYSATIPINYDRIINVQTLAVNYNLLYITERGVHALSSQGSTLLSEPLNGADNIPSRTFLSRVQMYHYKPYNEVLIYEPPQDNVIPSPGAKDKGAYVYSLDAGYWSSRDFVGQRLNNDEAYLRESTGSGGYVHTIYDLASREGSAPLNMRISSRPIKFGAMEFKRLETFIQRLSAYPGVTVSFVFSGSNDLVNRTELRRLSLDDVVRDITLRRFPFSCRYLYVDMEIDFKQQESAYIQIGAIDMEYYFRFLHRLR